MTRILSAVLIAACLPLAALDSVYFEVFPDCHLYGAMGRISDPDDHADVIIRARDPWYIDRCVVKAESPDQLVLQELLSARIVREVPAEPCPANQKPKQITYTVLAPRSNTLMYLTFRGMLVTCGGTGGTPPPFEATICHADLDVDSDNSSQVVGKAPDKNIAEDALEDQSGSNGVMLFVNRGFDEQGGDISGPDDWQTADQVKVDDRALVTAVVTVYPRAGVAEFTYDPGSVHLFLKSDGSPIEPGEGYRFPVGETELLIEGAAIGTSDIKISFQPDDATNTVRDAVRYTVIDSILLSAPDLYLADSTSWFPYRFRFEGIKADDKVLVLDGRSQYYVNGTQGAEEKVLNRKVTPSIRSATVKSRVNGYDQDYFGLIDESSFEDIDTGADVVKTASVHLDRLDIRLNDQISIFGGGTQVFGPLMFGDRTIESVDIGLNEAIPLAALTTRQNRLQNAGEVAVIDRSDAPPTVLPKGDTVRGWDETLAGTLAPAVANRVWIFAQLLDDNDFWRGSLHGVVAEARVLDEQRGAYLVVYYNQVAKGQQAGGSGFDKPVVGSIHFAGGTADFGRSANIRLNIADNDQAAIVEENARIGVQMAGLAAKWIGKTVPTMKFLELVAVMAELIDARPIYTAPVEFAEASIFGGFGRVEDVRIADDPAEISPHKVIAQLVSRGNTMLAGDGRSLCGRTFDYDNGKTSGAAWTAGNLYQCTVSSMVVVRALSHIRFRRSISARARVTYDPNLHITWEALSGSSAGKIYGE